MGEAASPAITGNAITGNAITGNAITGNAITGNAITGNAITGNAITGNGLTSYGPASSLLPALQDPSATGNLSRMFMQYLVGCALGSSQVVNFSWTDSSGTLHQESYAGSIGLATSWATGPLDDRGQHLVSSCMAARTNYFGVHVSISLRADVDVLEDSTTSAELGQYSYIEGAFWGNLFAPTPYLSACYKGDNVAHSRAAQRECAAGYLDSSGVVHQCDPVNILGECSDICRHIQKNGGYYTGCYSRHQDDVNFDDVLITVGLQ